MSDHAPSTGGIVGYRRSRRNIFGLQARLARVEGGVLRVLDADGREDEGVDLRAAEVQLRRGLVEVSAGDRRFYLYGLASANRIPADLVALAAREPADQGIGVAPEGLVSGPRGAAEASRALIDVLSRHGARVR
jgi:hypothetical protein